MVDFSFDPGSTTTDSKTYKINEDVEILATLTKDGKLHFLLCEKDINDFTWLEIEELEGVSTFEEGFEIIKEKYLKNK